MNNAAAELGFSRFGRNKINDSLEKLTNPSGGSCRQTRHRGLWNGLLFAIVLLVGFQSPSYGLSDATQPARPSVKIAFIGDQGVGRGAREVLRLISAEKADALMHQGDMTYGETPSACENQLNQILGRDFPYFLTIGNHEMVELRHSLIFGKQPSLWYRPGGFHDRYSARLRRLSIPFSGDPGVKAHIRYRGLSIVQVAPGIAEIPQDNYEAYIDAQFKSDRSTWRICSWHQNQRDMQVGDKPDQTGWGVYEACGRAGAIIATAHEHSYSRTKLLSNFSHKRIVDTGAKLIVKPGQTFAFVSGLGGRSIRPQKQFDQPWQAVIYTKTQGANFGALFGVFGVNGRDDLAHFYFKTIDGLIVDDFWVERVIDR